MSANYIINKDMSNKIAIPSRFFLAPINTGLAPNGKPNKKFFEFYRKRSGNDIGITYIGNVAVGEEWRTNLNTPLLSNESKKIWEDLATIIEKNGSLPGIQIACRKSIQAPSKLWNRVDAKRFIDDAKEYFSNISSDVIHRIKNAFIQSCRFAIESGFRVIQIHAAHGYFLSQLLDNRINRRTDTYGANPLDTIKELIEIIKKQDGDIIADIRLSLYDGIEDKSIEFERKSALIEQISMTDIDIISISNGSYDYNKKFIYPPVEWGHGPFIKDVTSLAVKHPTKIFNVAGNIWDLRKIPTNIPGNLSFSIGRALIADPEIIKKSIGGRFDEIVWCTRRGSCHYYTKGHSEIFCPFDPILNTRGKSISECSNFILGPTY